MTHADAAALFDRRRRAWLAEDEAAYLDCWTEDMRFASPVHVPPLVGRAAYAALVRRSGAVIRPVAFEVHHLALDGQVVLAEWTIRVADRTSGREAGWDGMSRAWYQDGRIAEWREYWNPADVRAATAS
jgi:limonene-1,2-epoxide hydrolase